jgi:hypothetical protein
VVEDFGHHPTALAETLQAFRQRHPGHTLTAVFEPRSNTARTKVLQAGFMRALAQADEVYLGAVNRAEKLAAGDRFDTAAVVQLLDTQGIEAHAADTNAALLEELTLATLQRPGEAARGDVFQQRVVRRDHPAVCGGGGGGRVRVGLWRPAATGERMIRSFGSRSQIESRSFHLDLKQLRQPPRAHARSHAAGLSSR